MSLSDLMSCSYGSADLVVDNATWTDAPVIEKDLGETGRSVKAEISGYITDTTAAGFAKKVEAARASLSRHGLDLVIKGINGATLMSLPAAMCLNGGPFCEFTPKLGSTPLRMDYTIKISSDKQSDGSGGGPGKGTTDSFTLDTKVRPDFLRVISRKGKVKGAGAADVFVATQIPAWRKQWPLPKWVTEVEYQSTSDENQSSLEYTLTATELTGTLPGNAAGFAVSGERSESSDRDEQLRQTTSINFDLLVSGDADALLQLIRPQKEVIVRETFEKTGITEQRIRATFVILKSASGLPLMNFTQTFTVIDAWSARLFEEKRYAGADPIIIMKPRGLQKLVQTGSATCLQRFIHPPRPKYSAHAVEPQYSFVFVNDNELQTTWHYEMFIVAGAFKPETKDFEGLFKPNFIDRKSLDPKFYPAGFNALAPDNKPQG